MRVGTYYQFHRNKKLQSCCEQRHTPKLENLDGKQIPRNTTPAEADQTHGEHGARAVGSRPARQAGARAPDEAAAGPRALPHPAGDAAELPEASTTLAQSQRQHRRHRQPTPRRTHAAPRGRPRTRLGCFAGVPHPGRVRCTLGRRAGSPAKVGHRDTPQGPATGTWQEPHTVSTERETPAPLTRKTRPGARPALASKRAPEPQRSARQDGQTDGPGSNPRARRRGLTSTCGGARLDPRAAPHTRISPGAIEDLKVTPQR